ncbi:kinase domain protein [Chaetomium sp. MPI-CAGE-AT-0009]|nr:kinase domain protein [Chaetomium sp. MPI-CAGE-AT-0009]
MSRGSRGGWRGLRFGLYRRAPLPPRSFSNPRYESIPESLKIEEETLPDYRPERFYPVRIGEVFGSRYQVVGKLGYGTTSTMDSVPIYLINIAMFAVKVFVRSAALGSRLNHERNVYQRINNGPRSHPGRDAVRSLLDAFQLEGPHGEHQPSSTRIRVGRLPNPVLAVVLYRLFQALDYLHGECGIIHTDIKPDNIMFGFKDDSPLAEFEQAEMDSPSPRKEVNGRVVYVTRQIPMPKALGPPVLCDFGAAVFGDKLHDDDVQPDQYRCPEVILEIPWSYKIDVWNIGCLVWDLFEGGHLFRGIDPEHGVYRGRAHLAEMIALLGPPTPELINRGNLRAKFFSESGEWKAGIKPLPPVSLEKLETTLEGADKQLFLQLMEKLLQWAPEYRMAPRELIKDPWVVKHLFGRF